MSAATIHNPATSAAPIGAYSNGISAPAGGRWLHIAGQVGIALDGSLAAGFAAQADQAWRNVIAILADAGMNAGNLVKVTHFLVRADDVKDYAPIRARHLGAARPASTLLVIQALAKPEFLVEVDAVAWKAG